MNNNLWKLGRIIDKLWIIASLIASEASKWGADGRGFAIVADETRNVSVKLNRILEKAIINETTIDRGFISDMVTRLSFLALNAAIESTHSDYMGKTVAICADDIRNLVTELLELLGENKQSYQGTPLAEKPLTSVDNRVCFMQFFIDGYRIIENVHFIREVIFREVEKTDTHIKLRGSDIPIINCFSQHNKEKGEVDYIIIYTPWAKKKEIYAVAVYDFNINSLFFSPIGTSIEPVLDIPLSKYIRECWESTDGEPFRFMDWNKLNQRTE